jgi:hypothetical protein
VTRATIFAIAIAGCARRAPDRDALAPEFPSQDAQRWLGGPPTSLSKLEGDVVLVEAWSRH